jgi:hypothetical protein
MSTLKITIAIVCMALILMGAPCVNACPYSVTGASDSTDDGSTCGQNTCTDNTCSTGSDDTCSDGTCSTDSEDTYSPYSYGAFKCTNGDCVGKYCVNGKCDTSEVTNPSAGNATGAVVCKDGTCEAKVCDGNGTCETGSFSTSGDDSSIAAWFSSFFGGSDDSEVAETSSSEAEDTETIASETEDQEVSTPSTVTLKPTTTTTPSNSGITYSITGSSTPKTSSTNYFGSLAMSGNTESNDTPAETTVAKTDTTTVAEVSAPTTTATKEDNSACTSYDKIYAALKADKTEKKELSESYTSMDFAQDVCAAMTAQGIDCTIIKVTFTDGSVNYLNAFDTCDGQLLVDSCGTSIGTGIKKQVTVLEVGQQWTAKSLFGECTKTYTRGTVSSIE